MSNIVLIWVWGSGMSALAQILYSCGYTNVIGIDGAVSMVTDMLSAQGIQIIIWHGVYQVQKHDFVIYSDATIHSPEVLQAKNYAKPDEKHFRYPLSYFEFVWEISKYMQTIAIAGTHGKSTTTSMMISALHDHPQFGLGIVWAQMKQFDCANFVIAEDKKNYIQEIMWHIISAKHTLQHHDLIKKYRFVIEADEFNRHFLYLDIDHLLITNIQRDHPDTYPTEIEYMSVFGQCVDKTHDSVTMLDDGKHQDFKKKYTDCIQLCPLRSYSFDYIFGQHNSANASLVQWFCDLHLAYTMSESEWGDSGIQYRDDLTVADREVYKSIRLEMLQEAPEAFGVWSYDIEKHYPDQYRKDKMQEPGRYRLFVYDAGQCIWAINAKIWNDDPHAGGIFGVYLRVPYRWKEIGRQMMNRCIDFFQYPRWVTSIKLRVLCRNTHAIRFYQKYGFQIQEKTVIDKHGTTEEMYVMTYRPTWMKLCQYPWIIRRCEYLGQTWSSTKIYSDYAHHPTEVSATYQALCQAFPRHRIHIIYQPHQAGRVLNLRDEMVDVCSQISHLVLYRIYTAREDIVTLLSQQSKDIFVWLQDANELGNLLTQKTQSIYFLHFEDIQHYINNLGADDIVCIMTAGDLDGEIRRWMHI